jgi:rhomboid family GlyGly-CTERM serine protease
MISSGEKTRRYRVFSKTVAMITERAWRSSAGWVFALLASLLILGLQAGGQELRLLLQYDRAGLQAGEAYRLLSGHWVHLDWHHALLNVTGLWLLALLEAGRASLRSQLLRCLLLCFAVGAALYVFDPELDWYVGLSGVLHGLFVMALVHLLYRQRDPVALVVLMGLIGKLAWEHYHGALTQGLLQTPVIVAAHGYGALAGLVYAVCAEIAARKGSNGAHA